MQYTGCRPLTDGEYSAILNAFDGRYRLRDQALFELGVRTGFRISEILAVKVGDVFREGKILGALTVKRCWMKGKYNDRSMPLHPIAAKRIEEWIRETGFDHPEMKEQPLFSRQHTCKALSRMQAWTILKRTAIKAGLDAHRVASHSMRKTFASRMWNSPFVQKDMAKMARLLGHQNYSNTLRYLEFLDTSLESAVLTSA